MSPQHRHYLFVEQGIGAGIFNFLLNGAIAWLLFRGMTTVPLWGQQSIGGDTLWTTFLLPLFTTLIASRIVRGHVRTGHVPAMPWPPSSPGRRTPRSLGLRGFLLGVVFVLAVGLPATRVLEAAGVAEMSFGRFLAFKAAFAGALAVLVTPLVARAALADA